MEGNDDGSASLIAEFHMTTSLADLREANFGEHGGSFLARNNGQRWTHAGINTVVIIGGSSESGRSTHPIRLEIAHPHLRQKSLKTELRQSEFC
jgi:hypothetical protein